MQSSLPTMQRASTFRSVSASASDSICTTAPAQTMSAALLQVRMLDDLDGDDLKSGLRDLRSTLSFALEEIYELIESLGGRGSGGVIAAPPLLGYLLVYLKNPLCVASIVLAMVCAWLASSIVTQRRQRRLSGA